MVAKPKIARKLRLEKQDFIFFCHFLEYTRAFSSATSVCTWDFRYATSICMCSAYATGHVCHTKSCFLRRTPSKWVGRCMNE
jgi:hypothetical protein